MDKSTINFTGNIYLSSIYRRFYTMLNRVLHQRLQQHRGNANLPASVVGRYFKLKSFSKPALLQQQVIFQKIELLREQNQLLPGRPRRIPKGICQLSNQHPGVLIFCRYRCTYTIQRIEQEMGLGLCLKAFDLRPMGKFAQFSFPVLLILPFAEEQINMKRAEYLDIKKEGCKTD